MRSFFDAGRSIGPDGGAGRAYEKPMGRDITPFPAYCRGKPLPVWVKPLGRRRKSLLGYKAFVLRQLADMAEAGLPLAPALEALEEDIHVPIVWNDLEILRKAIVAGNSLSDAMASDTTLFSALDCVLVQMGESAGQLAAALRLAANLTNHELRMRSFMRSLLLYPAIVLLILGFFSMWHLVFMVPRMEKIALDLEEGAAPAASRILGSVQLLGFVSAAGLLALVAISFARRLSPRLGRWKYRVPMLGRVWQNGSACVFLHAVAQCMKAGVPSGKVVQLCFEAVGDRAYRNMATLVREQVDSGRTLSETLPSAGLLPQDALALLALGEKSGRLPEAVEEARDLTASRFAAGVRKMETLATPCAVFVVAVPVGWFGAHALGLLARILSAQMGAMQ